jgi:hypothetical protein
MGLIRFIFRLLLNLVGAVFLLVLIVVLAAWLRGRWASEEVLVDWLQHGANSADVMHSTQFNLGGNLYINDTQNIVLADAAPAPAAVPATMPAAVPSTAPTTLPAAVAATTQPHAVEVRGVKRNTTPGYVAASGPGLESKFSAFGLEYGDTQTDAGRFRWILAPYWLLAGILAIPFVLWMLVSLRTRATKSRRACPSCHCDLGKPIRRCPECGSQLAKPLQVK